MMNSSMENIQVLEERERKIKGDIRRVSEIGETFLINEHRLTDKPECGSYSRILDCLEA